MGTLLLTWNLFFANLCASQGKTGSIAEISPLYLEVLGSFEWLVESSRTALRTLPVLAASVPLSYLQASKPSLSVGHRISAG